MTDLAHGAPERTPFLVPAPTIPVHTTSGGIHPVDSEGSAATRRAQRALRLAIGYTPRNDLEGARIALIAKIKALEACLGCRKPKLRQEVQELLQGARDLVKADDAHANVPLERLEAAATQYRMAQKVYFGYVQKANRPLYVWGVLFSAVALAVLPFVLYGIARMLIWTRIADEHAAEVFAAADLPSMLVLFGFAGLGSVASVLTRLDKIPTSAMFTWQLVFMSGAGRPLVAAAFATVIYAVFKGGIIKLGAISDSPDSYIVAGGPQYWCFVVAFLCGYSERFAVDLLGRSPFGGDSAAAAPAPTKSAVRTSSNGAEPNGRSDGRAASALRQLPRSTQRTHSSAASVSDGKQELLEH